MRSPRLHFSVDDVFESLVRISDDGGGLFEAPFFAFLQELHERWGIDVDVYLFFRQRIDGRVRTLREVSSSLAGDFQSAPWLRLGPHALDYDHAPYAQSPRAQRAVFDAIYAELDRFAGAGRRASWVRLHYFSEAFGIADYWSENGVTTLLLTDKPAGSYHLPDPERERLLRDGRVEFGGMSLRRSHERVENIAREAPSEEELVGRLRDHADRHGALVLFSHEVDLGRGDVRDTCHRCLELAQGLGLIPHRPR